MDIALTPDIRTVEGNRGSLHGADDSMPLINPVELQLLLQRLYPEGLGGKRFLDCACNGGGYSLLASDLGAYSFGFDVREHWIEQARFLKSHFGKSDDQVRFEVHDLFDLDERLISERFDICLFKGIFYHLPDPIAGLKIVADRTDEVLILDSAAVNDAEDGFLKLVWEGVDNPMSGVHRLAWCPTGPVVLCRILEWLGFHTTCVVSWREHTPEEKLPARVRIVGARSASTLAALANPPAPSILVPRDGDIVSGTCAVHARTFDHVVDVPKVEFRLAGESDDDTIIGAATGTTWEDWVYDWDTAAVPNGTYTLQAAAFNLAGGVGPSVGVTITVQN